MDPDRSFCLCLDIADEVSFAKMLAGVGLENNSLVTALIALHGFSTPIWMIKDV
jgi:hypothetical protein